MIDLHTHTNRSDGTLSPEELVSAAIEAGLRAIAITDHDTFDGFYSAELAAKDAGLELVCGIELSTRHDGRSTHLLAYFLDAEPDKALHSWLHGLQKLRKERNKKIAQKLQDMGIDTCIEEAESLGKSITGRLHFARALVAKDIVHSVQEAFDRYLGENAPAFVDMEEPELTEAIQRVRDAGGVPVLAHPVRLGYRSPLDEERVLRNLAGAGLEGIEVYHPDHSGPIARRYLGLARKYCLCVTGGSDFHGDAKPRIQLGRGTRGNATVPYALLTGMRSNHAHRRPVPA